MRNSVVMATYNGEKFIIEQLDSIKNQTLPPDEVIICDDCSTDNTVKIIKDYIDLNKLDGWKIYINSENLGFYNNFFNALRKCSGDVIYFSDQDDVWDTDKIKAFTDLYAKYPEVMMIQSNHKYIDDCGCLIENNRNYHGISTGHIVELSTYDMCKFCGSGFTMSFRKKVSDRVFSEGYDKEKELFEYHDIVLGLVSASEGKCILDRDIIDSHRLHNNNVTEQKNRGFFSGRTKADHMNTLKRRKEYFENISKITSDMSKNKIFYSFSEFAENRYGYLKKFNVKNLCCLIKNFDEYGSKLGFISDTMYSLGLEKLVLIILKYI